MKKALFFFSPLIILFSINCLAQETDKNFENGVKSFQSKNYNEAITFFTASMVEYPSASNSYFNRAVSYFYIGDSCHFCADLKVASSLGHSDAPKLYDENCTFRHIEPLVPDYLKLKFPEALRLEVIHTLCSSDSSVYVVLSKGDTISTLEIYSSHQSDKGEIFTIVENMPAFPGGEEARNRFLAEKIVYPNLATMNGIQGTVYVSFVIDLEGNVTDVKVLRGIGGGCDEESVRVVKLMPKWIPGTQFGKAVRVKFNMPIYYKLEGPGIPKFKN